MLQRPYQNLIANHVWLMTPTLFVDSPHLYFWDGNAERRATSNGLNSWRHMAPINMTCLGYSAAAVS